MHRAWVLLPGGRGTWVNCLIRTVCMLGRLNISEERTEKSSANKALRLLDLLA